MSQTQVPATSQSRSCDARVSTLRNQLHDLRSQRRFGSDFVQWRPDIFYYLLAVAVSALIVAVSWSIPALAIVLAALVLVAQFYVQRVVNHFLYWALIRLPNYRLQRRIDAVQSEIKVLIEESGQAQE